MDLLWICERDDLNFWSNDKSQVRAINLPVLSWSWQNHRRSTSANASRRVEFSCFSVGDEMPDGDPMCVSQYQNETSASWSVTFVNWIANHIVQIALAKTHPADFFCFWSTFRLIHSLKFCWILFKNRIFVNWWLTLSGNLAIICPHEFHCKSKIENKTLWLISRIYDEKFCAVGFASLVFFNEIQIFS